MSILFFCLLSLFMLITCALYTAIVRKHLDEQAGLADGFVFLLAIQQMIALPFLYQHAAFQSYLYGFAFTQFAVLSYALFLILKKKQKLFILPSFLQASYHFNKIIFYSSLIVIIFVILCATIFQKPDLDDATYLGMMQQDIGDRHLRLTNPETGNTELPVMPLYRLQSWELFLANLSHLANLSVPVIAHSFTTFFIIVFSILVYAKLLGRLVKQEHVVLAVGILMFIFLFSGFSRYSQGAFLLGRTWQGKTVLLHIILPLLVYQLLRFFENPRDNRTFIYISILCLSGFSVNPSAIYLIGILVFSFGLIAIYKKIALLNIFKLMCSLVPLVLLTGLIYLELRSFISNAPLPRFDLYMYGSAVLPFTPHILVLLFGYKFIPIQNENSKILFIFFPILLALTFLNPLLSPFIAEYLTSPWTYWRLFWLLPAELLLSLLGVTLLLAYLDRKSLPLHLQRKPVFQLLLFAVGVMLIGRFLFTSSNHFELAKTPHKLPSDIIALASFIKSAEVYYDTEVESKGFFVKSYQSNRVLADKITSAYLRSMSKQVELLYSREHNMKLLMDIDSEAYTDRVFMQNVVDGKSFPNENPEEILERFISLLRKYEVHWLIIENKNGILLELLENNNFSPAAIFKRTGIFHIEEH